MQRSETAGLLNDLGINSVQLLGRVGQFPKKGKGDVWRFPLATSHKFQGKDEFGGRFIDSFTYGGASNSSFVHFLTMNMLFNREQVDAKDTVAQYCCI